MTYLSKLNITQLKRPTRSSPQEQRRHKLIAKLEEQLALAEAQQQGKRYIVMKNAWTRDDSGTKIKVQREKVVRPWFWADENGMTMVVRYTSRPLEFAKGKRALSAPGLDAIPNVINTLIAAVKAGELDHQMEAAIAASKTKTSKV